MLGAETELFALTRAHRRQATDRTTQERAVTRLMRRDCSQTACAAATLKRRRHTTSRTPKIRDAAASVGKNADAAGSPSKAS